MYFVTSHFRYLYTLFRFPAPHHGSNVALILGDINEPKLHVQLGAILASINVGRNAICIGKVTPPLEEHRAGAATLIVRVRGDRVKISGTLADTQIEPVTYSSVSRHP